MRPTTASSDAGVTWQRRGTVATQPQAVGAAIVDGALRVLVVTGDAVLQSTDGAATFSVLPDAPS
jgi:hypothetical protein